MVGDGFKRFNRRIAGNKPSSSLVELGRELMGPNPAIWRSQSYWERTDVSPFDLCVNGFGWSSTANDGAWTNALRHDSEKWEAVVAYMREEYVFD